MTPNEETLHQYVVETIGDRPGSWPGGWPGEIEAALIDAVFSVRAHYGHRAKKNGRIRSRDPLAPSSSGPRR